jgi:dihydrofolate reductase
LDAVSTANTRLLRTFDPVAVRGLKSSAASDLTIGGAHLAAQALESGLLDECHLFIRPVLIGRGKPALTIGARADLELVDDRQLSDGVVYLRYRIPSAD